MSVSDGQQILKRRSARASVNLDAAIPAPGPVVEPHGSQDDYGTPSNGSPGGHTPEPRRSETDPTCLWAVLLAVLGLIVLYFPVFFGQHEVGELWLTNDTYSHGLLVVPASLVLLWLLRDRLRAAAYAPDPNGLAWIALGLISEVVGWQLRIKFLMMASLTPLVAGCILALHGRAFWKVARFPVLFLLFAVPIPGPALSLPSNTIQEASTIFSTRLMDTLGFAVIRAGNVIIVPGARLEVADACSGFRKLYAMLAFAVFYGYLYKQPARKRAFLILAVIPIATAANITRIAGLIAVACNWQQRGLDFVHDAAEILVVIISAVLFFTLSRRVGCVQTRFAVPASAVAVERRQMVLGRRSLRSLKYFLVQLRDDLRYQNVLGIRSLRAATSLCALVLCSLFINLVLPRLPEARPYLVPIRNFPRNIGNWVNTEDLRVDAKVKKNLPSADIVQRVYHDNQNRTIGLTLVTATDYADFHDPSVCIPAQGWDLSPAIDVGILELHGPKQSAKLVTADLGGTKLAVLYWLSGDFTRSPTFGRQTGKLLALRELLTGEQGGSIVVRVDAPDESRGTEEGKRTAMEFAEQILEPLKALTPQAVSARGKP